VTATKELCKRWDGSAQLCGAAKTVGDSISVLSLAPQDPPWSQRTSLTSPSGAGAASAAGTGGERRRSGGAEEGRSQAQAGAAAAFVLDTGAIGGIGGEGVEEPSWGGVELKLEPPPLSLCLRRRRQELFSGGG
jgi:hypothetical protein